MVSDFAKEKRKFPFYKELTISFWVLFSSVVLMLVLTGIFHFYTSFSGRKALSFFNLSNENNIATWFSSMLLLLASVVSFFCFLADSKRFQTRIAKFLNNGWVIFSIIFLILSLDEIASIHETIGDAAIFNSLGSSFGWQVFYYLIAAVAGFIVLFTGLRLYKVPAMFLVATVGVGCYLSLPFQENFEIHSWKSSVNPTLWKRPVKYILLEEGAELMGSLCFLVALTRYFVYSFERSYLFVNSSAKSEALLPSSLLKRYIVSLFLFLLVVFIFSFDDKHIAMQSGIAMNWVPAAASFLLFLSGMIQYRVQRLTYFFWIGVWALIMSVYTGGNIYHYSKGLTAVVQNGIAATILLAVSMLVIMKMRNQGNKKLIAFSLFSGSIGILFIRNNSLILGLVFIFLFLLLTEITSHKVFKTRNSMMKVV